MEVIKLTKAAQQQVRTLLDREENPREGLRVAVVGKTCEGPQYKIGWDDSKGSDFTHEYDNGLKVFVDSDSLFALQGTALEFHDGIEESGFKVVPEAGSSNPGGCGGCDKTHCNN